MRQYRRMRGGTWTVVVPVKALAAAKTRLRGAVVDAHHEALVLAMALDTVVAALATDGVDRVVVVTADPVVTAEITRAGAEVTPEPAGGGLNAALAQAAHAALRGPVPPGAGPARAAVLARTVLARAVALPADLPALRPDELGAALRAAGAGLSAAYVPDASGTGTVLLAAPAGGPLAPRFGPGSAAAHARAGARRLVGDWPALRHDVDTPDDLAAAVRLGLGRHTTALLGVALR